MRVNSGGQPVQKKGEKPSEGNDEERNREGEQKKRDVKTNIVRSGHG